MRGSSGATLGRGGRGAVDGGGDVSSSSSAALTATQIGFGSGANVLTGDGDLTYDSATGIVTIGGATQDGMLYVRRGLGAGDNDDYLRMSYTDSTADNGGIVWYSEGIASEMAAIRLHWAAVLEGSVAPKSMEFSGATAAYYFDGPVQAGSGSVSSPGLSFSTQSDAGFYRIGANNLGLSIAGTKRMDFAAGTITVNTACTVEGTFTANTISYYGGQLGAPAGSAAAPSFSFSGDPNTGFYNIGADQVGLSTAGVLRMAVYTNAVEFSLPLYMGTDGTVALPSLGWGADQDLGFYRVGANDMAATCGNSQKQRWNNTGVGFYNTAPVTQRTSGADLTNNVTVGGANDTIADFTSLTVYSTDAAAIRNNIYQLARKLKQINDGLRAYGLFT